MIGMPFEKVNPKEELAEKCINDNEFAKYVAKFNCDYDSKKVDDKKLVENN